MTAFGNLDRTALLGTQHAAWATATGEPALDALVDASATFDAEAALLTAAGMRSAILRAATRPPSIAAKLEAAGPESLPICGPAAAADLRAALDSGVESHVAEWFEYAATYARRVPEELLPDVLDVGRRRRDLRPGVLAVIGARGTWLAAQEQTWRYAVDFDDPRKAYEESGDRDERVRALKDLRRVDPSSARATLEAGWTSEVSADRAALLEALDSGLSLDDEPFLEAARLDARQDVRTAANALLHHLAASRSAQRAIAWIEPLIVLERGIDGLNLVVEPPEEVTAHMKADGVKLDPTGSAGQRAFCLQQLVGFVPPQHWRTRFGLDARAFLTLAAKSDYREALVRGFAVAVAGYRDNVARREWLALAVRDDDFVEPYVGASLAFSTDLADEPLFIEALQRPSPFAVRLLTGAKHRWAQELSAAALAYARRDLDKPEDWQRFTERATLFAVLANFVDPFTPAAMAGWPEAYANDKTARLVERFLHHVTFRKGMRDHLKDGS